VSLARTKSFSSENYGEKRGRVVNLLIIAESLCVGEIEAGWRRLRNGAVGIGSIREKKRESKEHRTERPTKRPLGREEKDDYKT